MDFSTENINAVNLPEIPKLIKKFKCEFCNKEFKSKKGHLNHIKKFHATDESDNVSISSDFSFTEEPPLAELSKLKKELENLILNNPSIDIDRPVNTTILERINGMTVEELKARIFNAKRELNGKLDMKISDGALSMINQVVGRLLGCCEELEQEVMKDALLRESTKELLSMNVLSKIPSQIKVAGLYSLNVGTAMSKRKQKFTEVPPVL